MKGEFVTITNYFTDAKVYPSTNFPVNLKSGLVARGMDYGIINRDNIVMYPTGDILIEVKWYTEDHTFITKFFSMIDDNFDKNLELIHLTEGPWNLEETLKQLDQLAERL